MITQLDLYILNNDNSVAPFPSEAEQIVLYDFAFEAQRMGGAPEITATIQANGSLENSLTTKVFCEYNGERYFLKSLPSSSKENTDPRYTFDLTFVSERTILDNVYMIDAVQGDSSIDHYQSNSTNIVFMGDIKEAVARLNTAMTYAGVGYSVVLDEGITSENKLVSFQDKFFTEALQEIVNIHNIPYYYVGKVIHFGWSQTTVPALKYGDGLLSINKTITSDRIVNRATAVGGSENIPYYYPNSTPKGSVVLNNPNGLNIEIESETKLSGLPSGSFLIYKPEPSQANIFCQFHNTLYENQVYDDKYERFANIPAGYDAGAVILVAGLSASPSQYEGKISATLFADIRVGGGSLPAKMSDVDIAEIVAYKNVDGGLVEDSTLSITLGDIKKYDSQGTIVIEQYITVDNIPVSAPRYIGIKVSNNGWANSLFFNFTSRKSDVKSGWYIANNNGITGDVVTLEQFGLKYLGATPPPAESVIGYNSVGKIPYATALMPPIYRSTDGEERFYNAINGAYEGVVFENEYSEENPKEAIITLDHIKPTIVGITNADGERIDMFAEFEYDRYDSDETVSKEADSEEYVHPYFYAKLRRLNGDFGFNLFDQAIESGEMTIEMTSGHCGACKFSIMVDSNTQRNLVLVNDDGDLVFGEDGKVKMATDGIGLDRQNDTRNHEVWVALKKDHSTYGQLMPMANTTVKPGNTDTFVITNIILPQAYITAAEARLEKEIIEFILRNNSAQYSFDINFSRIFLKNRSDVFDTLSENSLIPIEYNGKTYKLYVSSYTYRKQKNEVLPEISVSLSVSLDATTSTFQQAVSAIETNLEKKINSGSINQADADDRYLRKDAPDAVKEKIAFEKGLSFDNTIHSKNFKSGDLTGEGFGVYTDDNGNAVIEADRIVIRKEAKFNEIVINQMSFQQGQTVFSAGGCDIVDVKVMDDVFRCYYDNKSGTRFSGFVPGDQARCQRFDESYKTVVKYYWRVVKAIGENYVDLYIAGEKLVDGSGIPEIGDHIVHLGNISDKTRQNAIVIASTPTPSIIQYENINSFSLPDPVTQISPGDNRFTGKVHIGAGSTGAENIEGLPKVIQDIVGELDLDIDVDSLEFGKYNLLRNSGFTGDYLSAQLQSGKGLNEGSQLFSPNLEYWNVSNVSAQESSLSESGVEAIITNGSLSQTLKNKILVGENYVVSFKAKGTSLTFSIGGVSKVVALTDEYTRYVEKFTASSASNVFTISSRNATICEVQLERGSVVSAWGHSMWDNQSELAYYQSLQYLASAMKDGSTTILGGLILSQLIALGNYKNGEMTKVTSGINGLYNDDDDVAFWAGGDLEKAILTVQKHRDNPLYQPTEEEWDNMAKFVTTHGGDVFMKGYIYALGGLFKGAVSIANGKILLNADGSGAMANGAFSWDTFGRITRYYPERENWIDLKDATSMSHDEGGFFLSPLREVSEDVEPISDEGDDALVIPTPTLSPYVFCVKGQSGDARGDKYRNKPFATEGQKVLFRVYAKDGAFVGHYLNITALPNQGTITVEYDSTPDDYSNTYYNITLPLTMEASYTSTTDTIEIR